MFDFFDKNKNPFMAMKNPENLENQDNQEEDGANGEMNPMQFMQQAWALQMQIARNMFMMPLQMMKGFAGLKGAAPDGGEAAEDGAPAQAGGFQLGPMQIPPELLRFLLKLEMSPENLKKLQKVLDFAFEMLPQSKSDDE